MDTKKLNKLNIKDFIKDTPPGARLQSLRLPRDLSLGGTKPLKKIYKPNLNVIRPKDKPKMNTRKIDNVKDKYGKSQDKQKQRYVQSTGVFSEGMGDTIRQPEVRVSVNVREKPPNLKKDLWVANKESEDNLFQEIIKYEDDSDSDTEEKVPFKPIDWCKSKLLEDPPQDEVKVEVPESLGILPKEYTDDTERSNSNLSLGLWQLPDSLPFRNASQDSKSNKLVDCNLTDLPEGVIGKICVRKSGKISVYVGTIKYELEPAQFETFVEELVCLDSKTPQSTATVLGTIDSRFLLNPDWDSLLH